MNPALYKAADEGDANFLIKTVAEQRPSTYFLAQHHDWGNIFHVATMSGNLHFLKEAINILPIDLQHQLLLQSDGTATATVLHTAAFSSNIKLVKCIVEICETLSRNDDDDHFKPSLALNRFNQTPLNFILSQTSVDQNCVMEIMLLDPEHQSCTIADNKGNIPLYYAVKNGYNLVVENILKFLKEAVAVVQPSDCSEYFFSRSEGENVFHLAAEQGNVEFLMDAINILSTRIPKQSLRAIDGDNYTVLHRAALNRDVTLVKCIIQMYASFSWVDEDHVKPWLALTRDHKTPLHVALRIDEPDEKCVMEILLMDAELTSCAIADKDGNTPLYYAVKNGLNQVVEKILMSPHPATSIISSSNFLELVDLTTANCSANVEKLLWEEYGGCLDDDGNTLLHLALNFSTSTQESALETLSTYPGLCKIRNNRGESPFFLAVKSGYGQVVDEIMRIDEPSSEMLWRDDGTTVLHCLSSCPESIGKRLLKKYWWLINLCDDHDKTALDYAKQANAPWLVDLLTKPSLIQTNDEFNWLEACKREEYLTVVAFVETCEDLQRVCRLQNDTPLHHIKLNTYKEYSNLLKNPSVAKVKNVTDHEGKTALHHALERKDINFAKALLRDKEVQQDILDYEDKTAMDLLAELCKEQPDWGKMFKAITKINTNYIKEETNLDQIRNTLSVVAALLATITFAAGFTLPGGLNSDSGEALLAKKAGFLVFLLADVYAMCTSMLVLFSLIWSMILETEMARLLVDRSLTLLMQSLYGTLMAFIAGIYTVVAHNSLWAAILVLVMCGIVGISANRTVLPMVISKIVPKAGKTEYQLQMLEEELLEVRTER